MDIDDSIAEIRALGFTHLEGWCRACQVISVAPLEMVERQALGVGLRWIAGRLRCRHCGGRIARVKPCHHGPGSYAAQPWRGPPFA
jgi:hypothetical protein